MVKKQSHKSFFDDQHIGGYDETLELWKKKINYGRSS